MEESQSRIAVNKPLRAPRFPIHIPIFYRERGHRKWRRGITINISKSGVRFLAEGPLKPRALVTMKMQLPELIHGLSYGEILCHGKVVRTGPGIRSKDVPVVSVVINAYRLARRLMSAPQKGQRRRTSSKRERNLPLGIGGNT
ncbi:MAG: PilZ domain-containing protein [Terriglobia bacterium]